MSAPHIPVYLFINECDFAGNVGEKIKRTGYAIFVFQAPWPLRRIIAEKIIKINVSYSKQARLSYF